MKQLEQLFRDHLSSITADRERWLTMITDDAVIEFPYAASIGFPTKVAGREEIEAYVRALPSGFEEMEISDLKITTSEDSGEVMAEFSGRILPNGSSPGYDQKYVAFLKARDGKIAHYREYWNPIEVTKYFPEVRK